MKTRYLTYAAAVITALTLAAGCTKVSVKTQLIVRPKEKTTGDPEWIPAADVRLYAYYVDASKWSAANYADAAEGIITDNATGEIRTIPDVEAEPYESGEELYAGALSLELERNPVMLVAVDRTHGIYGYRSFVLPENLPQMFIVVMFRPDHDEGTFTDSGWTMVNPAKPTPDDTGENDKEDNGDETQR